MINDIIVLFIGFIIGVLYGFFILATRPKHYKYRIKGNSRIYKMNKRITEEWADGLAKWECIELVDENAQTLNED